MKAIRNIFSVLQFTRIFLALALLLFCLFSSVAHAEIYGYIEARLIRIEGLGPEMPLALPEEVKEMAPVPFPEYITYERFRPTLVEEIGEDGKISLTVTPEIHFIQYDGQNSDLMETDDYLNVERLYLDLDAGPARIRLGRQAINWGSALIWNPTDMFKEVYLTDYWAERKGINAVKVYVPLPEDFRLTVAASTGDTVFSDNRYAARASLARWGADMSVVWMDDAANDLLAWGVDVKGTAVIGYWVEAAMFAPKNRDYDPYYQAVAGVDYSFQVRDGLYIAAQYYYDQTGDSKREDYKWDEMQAGKRSTLATHYANLMATLSWNSEISGTINAIYNLDDQTAMASPYLTVTLGKFRVTAGANIPIGPEGGEFMPHPDQDAIGLVPDLTYYAWVRYYL